MVGVCCCCQNNDEKRECLLGAGQGLTTLIGDQQTFVDKLKSTLLELVCGRQILDKETMNFILFKMDFLFSKQIQLKK
jgi:hypothetical protein